MTTEWERDARETVEAEANAFRLAVAEGRWGDAADMVRPFAKDDGLRDGGVDALAGWMRGAGWFATATPEAVAAEWDLE